VKLLALIPEAQMKSPCRIYRGDGVLERLRYYDRVISKISTLNPINNMPGELSKYEKEEIQVDYIKGDMAWNDWLATAKDHPVLFVMKSLQQDHVALCRRAQKAGIKIWYDFDDDYTAVGPDQPSFLTIQRKELQMAFAWFLNNAEAVTTSTQALADKFTRVRDGKRPIVVVPNALDDISFTDWSPRENPKGIIAWRGGGSHFIDLEEYRPSMAAFLRKEEDWALQFQGFYPWTFAESAGIRQEQLKVGTYIHDYWEYMDFLRFQVRPWALVVPLKDNAFNRGKSNIAALEAIWAGAIPIVPDWDEWQIPGAMRYTSPEGLKTIMHLVASLSEEAHQDKWDQAVDWLRTNRLLGLQNGGRMKVLEDLV
jgi:hypothetical protein